MLATHGLQFERPECFPRPGASQELRDGSGTGEGKALTPGQAHLLFKGAETDAAKRTLATFGNPFGPALYDRGQNGVRK